MKFKKYLLLAILPLVYFVITLYFLDFFPSFINNVDPEYCYLFNGLNLATLHLPWHIDHPGSTLQVFVAIIIRITHFANLSDTVIVDFLKNPEKFLITTKISIDIVNALAMFFAGLFIYKNSKNYFSSFIIQLSPLLSSTILFISNRLLVENFLIFIVLMLITEIFIYLQKQKYLDKKIDSFVWLFGLTIGFGIATKILFAPLFIIPLFILNGFKKKFYYGIIAFVSFFVFAFPIIDRMDYFFGWIKALFVHSGVYGQGDANVINFNEFYNNIHYIITNEIMLPFVLLSLLVCIVLFVFKFKKFKNDFYFKALVAVFITIILLVLIVAKQLKFYYLSPVLLLLAFGLFLSYKFLKSYFSFLNKKIIYKVLFFALLIVLYFTEFTNALIENKRFKDNSVKLVETYNNVHNKYNDLPKLIYADYYGAPFLEYSLFFGVNWAGEKMRLKYNKILLDLNHDVYIYHDWNKKFNYWDNNGYSIFELLEKYKSLYLYIGNSNIYNSLCYVIESTNFKKYYHLENKFNNTYTGQQIIKISKNPDCNLWSEICDCENIDSNKNFTNNNISYLGGITQSSDFSYSGKYSSKLSTENEFGILTYLSNVKKGDEYLISVWKYNNGNKNSVLAIATSDFQKYNNSSNTPVLKNGNWDKIEINLKIDSTLAGQDFKISCWFNNDNLPAYFDDFKIEKVK